MVGYAPPLFLCHPSSPSFCSSSSILLRQWRRRRRIQGGEEEARLRFILMNGGEGKENRRPIDLANRLFYLPFSFSPFSMLAEIFITAAPQRTRHHRRFFFLLRRCRRVYSENHVQNPCQDIQAFFSEQFGIDALATSSSELCSGFFYPHFSQSQQQQKNANCVM